MFLVAHTTLKQLNIGKTVHNKIIGKKCMIKDMACLGQESPLGLGLLAQRIPLPRKLRQRSCLNVDNKQTHTITPPFDKASQKIQTKHLQGATDLQKSKLLRLVGFDFLLILL